MIHRHKYGKVDNGYQYCEKCGKARPVPCAHNWTDNGHWKESSKLYGNTYNVIYVLKCTKCGDLKKVSLDD